LLPLLSMFKSIIDTVNKNAAPAHAAQLAEIQKFVTSVEERSKHYESQALVEKARQAALDEQKRLEQSKPIAP